MALSPEAKKIVAAERAQAQASRVASAQRRNAGNASIEAASAAERMFKACKLAGIPCTTQEVETLRQIFAEVGARADNAPAAEVA